MVNRRNGRAGSALMIAVITTMLLVAIAAALLTLVGANTSRQAQEDQGLHALYAAETAAAVVIAGVNAGNAAQVDAWAGADGIISPGEAPWTQGFIGKAAYNVTIVLWGRDGIDNNDTDNDPATGIDDPEEQRFLTVATQGYVPRDNTLRTWNQVRDATDIVARVTEVIVSSGAPPPGWQAAHIDGNGVYNPQGTTAPNTFQLNGTGSSADEVVGGVFINGNLSVSGSANIQGDVYATGTVTDTSSAWTKNSIYDIPSAFDFKSVDYRTLNDVNVTASLQTGAPGVNNGTGNPSLSGETGTAAQGNAWQILDKNNPAHIFRREASDRSETNNDGVDTYYMEDPTHAIRNDSQWDGTDASQLEFTPGFTENKVYYIKGDLWLHNQSAFSYKIKPPPGADRVRILIVVEGNINVGDNFFYNDTDKDAVAFIALKDPARTNSGNINIGDAVHGTTEQMRGFWFAENNVNLKNLGDSTATLINGNLYAGGNITQSSTASSRKLSIKFDSRLKDGVLDEWAELLPKPKVGSIDPYSIRSWRQHESGRALAPTAGPRFVGPNLLPAP